MRPAGVADDPTTPARLQFAELAVRSSAEADRIGRPIPVEAQLRWSRRLLDAELAAASSRDEQVRAAEAHIARVEQLAAAQAERVLAELTGPAAPGGPVRGITAEAEPTWNERWAEVTRLGTAAVQLRRWLAVARRREPPDHAEPSRVPGETDDTVDWPDWPRVDARPADEPRQRAISRGSRRGSRSISPSGGAGGLPQVRGPGIGRPGRAASPQASHPPHPSGLAGCRQVLGLDAHAPARRGPAPDLAPAGSRAARVEL